jgi:hypothetical protein
MRQDIYGHIKANKELKQYIREQPYWYRKLSRDPSQFNQFIISSKEYYKQTIPHRVEHFSQKLHMASMMINMFQVMRESD